MHIGGGARNRLYWGDKPSVLGQGSLPGATSNGTELGGAVVGEVAKVVVAPEVSMLEPLLEQLATMATAAARMAAVARRRLSVDVVAGLLDGLSDGEVHIVGQVVGGRGHDQGVEHR